MPPPRAKHIDIILEAALQLGATLDLDRLLALVLRRITDMLSSERALFALLDSQGEVQRVVTHALDWAGPGHPLPVSQSLIADAVRTGEPMFFEATVDDAGDRESINELKLRRVVAVPVHVGSGVIGVLYSDSQVDAAELADEEGVFVDFKGQYRELLVAVAKIVGTAVENARLYEESRFKQDFLLQAVHAMLAPATSLLLQVEIGATQGGASSDDIFRILANARRLQRMSQAALRVLRSDNGQEPFKIELVDVAAAVEERTMALGVLALEKRQSFWVELQPGLPAIATDTQALEIVLDNLIFNALKYGGRDTPIHVRAAQSASAGPGEAQARPIAGTQYLFRNSRAYRAAPGASWVALTISSEGVTLTEEQQARMFVADARGDHPAYFDKPTGLGLPIVDRTVRHLGGLVWVESAAGKTSFTFTLPTQVELCD